MARRDMVQPGPPPLGGWGATVIVLVSMQSSDEVGWGK